MKHDVLDDRPAGGDCPTKVTQEFARHKSVQTTMLYLHAKDQALKQSAVAEAKTQRAAAPPALPKTQLFVTSVGHRLVRRIGVGN